MQCSEFWCIFIHAVIEVQPGISYKYIDWLVTQNTSAVSQTWITNNWNGNDPYCLLDWEDGDWQASLQILKFLIHYSAFHLSLVVWKSVVIAYVLYQSLKTGRIRLLRAREGRHRKLTSQGSCSLCGVNSIFKYIPGLCGACLYRNKISHIHAARIANF